MPQPAMTIQIRFPPAPRPAQWRRPPATSPQMVAASGKERSGRDASHRDPNHGLRPQFPMVQHVNALGRDKGQKPA